MTMSALGHGVDMLSSHTGTGLVDWIPPPYIIPCPVTMDEASPVLSLEVKLLDIDLFGVHLRREAVTLFFSEPDSEES